MRNLDRRITRVMQKLEKTLVRFVVLGVLALVIVQLALARAGDPVDFYLTFAQTIETVPVGQEAPVWEHNLILTATGGDASKLKILVNDEEFGTLYDGKLALRVKPGDRLAADARKVPNGVRLMVSGVDQQFTYPRLNQVWFLRGSVLDLGTVKSK